MVTSILMYKLNSAILKYGLNSEEAYDISVILAFEIDKVYNKCKTIQSYYYESIKYLIKYVEENEKNPSEKRWDKYAISNNCLSSKTMGYIYGRGFNKLCRRVREQIKNIKTI